MTDKFYTTKELAEIFKVQQQSILNSHYLNGNYQGIVPKKMRNGRLWWPVDDVEKEIGLKK